MNGNHISIIFKLETSSISLVLFICDENLFFCRIFSFAFKTIPIKLKQTTFNIQQHNIDPNYNKCVYLPISIPYMLKMFALTSAVSDHQSIHYYIKFCPHENQCLMRNIQMCRCISHFKWFKTI